MNKACLHISMAALQLCLTSEQHNGWEPYEANIVSVRQDPDRDMVLLILEHPSFPSISEGGVIPLIGRHFVQHTYTLISDRD